MSDLELAVVPYDPPRAVVGSPASRRSWDEQKAAAVGEGGKFNAERRHLYLELRRAGKPHHSALYAVGISVSTYDRYNAAAGEMWKAQVRAAKEHSLDPIREVRRDLALKGEPWAVDREIGKGRATGGEEDPQLGVRGGAGTTVNVGVVGAGAVGISVEGGAAGVDGALHGMLERLRERAAVTAGEGEAE